jgi:uncharacterized protein
MQVQFEKNSLDLFTRSECFHKPKSIEQALVRQMDGLVPRPARSIKNNAPAAQPLTPRNGAHNPPTPRSLFFVSMRITFASMNKTVIEVQVRAVLPTSGGCAVFLGNNDKVFIIYVDQTVGSAITMFMRDISKERPLTHDLIAHLMAAVGAKVERVIINDLKNATYYARMIIRAENELQQKKIIELDGRPSDCIAMATQQKAPIYVSQEVWDEVDDMSDVLRKMEEDGLKPDPETESTEEE